MTWNPTTEKPEPFSTVFFVHPAGRVAIGEYLPNDYLHRRESFRDFETGDVFEATYISFWQPAIFPEMPKKK